LSDGRYCLAAGLGPEKNMQPSSPSCIVAWLDWISTALLVFTLCTWALVQNLPRSSRAWRLALAERFRLSSSDVIDEARSRLALAERGNWRFRVLRLKRIGCKSGVCWRIFSVARSSWISEYLLFVFINL
jgi:hypothetical protein